MTADQLTPTRLLSCREMAREAGTSLNTLCKYIAKGLIIPDYATGHSSLFDSRRTLDVQAVLRINREQHMKTITGTNRPCESGRYLVG
jgi:hypothetical protein